jgi:hypothetical protein
MPIPFDPPPAPPHPDASPMAGPVAPSDWPVYQLPDPQRYALDQERQRHIEALYRVGEYAMFVLMWNLRDYEKGQVGRCPTCWGGSGSIKERTAQVYKQAEREKCPDCYGTTFEGGWKAKIIRPSMWDFGEDLDGPGRRGLTVSATAAVQSTHDFQMRTGDFILRGDGVRWRVSSMSAVHLRVGYETPLSDRNIIAFNFGQAAREDESSVAYTLTPSTDDLRTILDVTRPRYPQDFSDYEEFRTEAILIDPYESPIEAP